MTLYTPKWPHSEIQQIFDNIYYVTGTNCIQHEGVILQHSRNMIIIRDGHELSLINTVRLNDTGLTELSRLGEIKNIIRLGSFHGRDDAFYTETFTAKLWELANMPHTDGKKADFILSSDGKMPFKNCKFYDLQSTQFPEGILHLQQEGGILITCDSIKNWLEADSFFSESTAKAYLEQQMFGPATISNIWRQATQVKNQELKDLQKLQFRHLLSAHGKPLLNDAYKHLLATLATL